MFLPYYPHGGGRSYPFIKSAHITLRTFKTLSILFEFAGKAIFAHIHTHTPRLNQYFEISCQKRVNCLKTYSFKFFIFSYTFRLSWTELGTGQPQLVLSLFFFYFSQKVKKLVTHLSYLLSFFHLISIYTIWYKSIPLVVHLLI